MRFSSEKGLVKLTKSSESANFDERSDVCGCFARGGEIICSLKAL